MFKKVNTKSKIELLKALEKEDFRRRTLSFYRYVKIENPKEMRDFLFDKLNDLQCLGRIYIAPEGINAQMNVPEHNWLAFDKFIESIKEFKGVPYKLAVEEKNTSSFLKLIVKVRPKIVADGLDDATFDPADTGEYATALEVNSMIERGVTVIDMRNFYEAAIGHFENAKIMKVDTFREQLSKVHDMFREKKDTEVLLYCTGGIRCEKASAWMKHNGFSKVKHIKGGVIDYARQVKELGLPNKFRGKNFVFDERMGERVGDEIISICQLCEKNKCDEYTHCQNQLCHVLFLCCPLCLKKYDNYCSRLCMFSEKLPKGLKQFIFRTNKQKHPNQYKKKYKRAKIAALS